MDREDEQEMKQFDSKKRKKAILKVLNDKFQILDKISNKKELYNWHLSLVTFVASFLDPKSKQYYYIHRNRIFDGGFVFDGSFEDEKNNAKTILQLIKQLVLI